MKDGPRMVCPRFGHVPQRSGRQRWRRIHSDGLSMKNISEDNHRVIGCRGALPRGVQRRHAGQPLQQFERLGFAAGHPDRRWSKDNDSGGCERHPAVVWIGRMYERARTGPRERSGATA